MSSSYHPTNRLGGMIAEVQVIVTEEVKITGVFNMNTIKNFNYLAPESAEEAVALLAKYGKEAELIAGGTDLLVSMKNKEVTPKYLIDIKTIPDLNYIHCDENEGLKIGALTEISTVRNSNLIKQRYFSIYEAAESFGTTQVGNMATIGGNICRSAPSADMVPPLLTFDSELKLVGPGGERIVLLEDFFTGPGENVLNNEILTEIKVPSQKEPYGTAFEKIKRTSEDLAKVNCAVKIVINNSGKCEDVRIALGAVAPTPIRARKVEEALIGKNMDDSVIEKAPEKVVEDIAPITDIRSNVEYRTHVSKVLIKRLIKRAMERRS